jgi:hypothetical protein
MPYLVISKIPTSTYQPYITSQFPFRLFHVKAEEEHLVVSCSGTGSGEMMTGRVESEVEDVRGD